MKDEADDDDERKNIIMKNEAELWKEEHYHEE